MRAILPLVFFAAVTSVPAQTQPPPAALPQSDTYTLRTESNVVLVPTTVQMKNGDMLYGLKVNQFVVEDNGVRQVVKLDEDTDSLGLSLAVVVQCSREAFMQYDKFRGLGAMIDGISGGAPREVALIMYGGRPVLLGKFSADPDAIQRQLSKLAPCDDPDASTYDAVSYATQLLEARQNHYRHAILLIGETRDHGSDTKPAKVIADLGRTNTVVDAVAFNPGKTEVFNSVFHGQWGPGPLGLLIMAVEALKKNVPKTLASLSGGEYDNFTTQKGFDNGMGRLSNHIHNYYLLSFQPRSATGGAPAGGMHSIKVSIPDYPEARIRARESYFSGTLEALPPAAQPPPDKPEKQ
jgi:VWFA-related protein